MGDMTLEQVANELRITARHGASLAPQTCHYLADAIDAAIKQHEQDAKDADRYRWLRLRLLVTEVESMSNVSRKHLAVQTAGDSEYIADLDETLDAAMAKESGNG